MDMKIPTLADTIVSNKGRYYGAGDQTRLIEVHLGRAASPGYTEPRFASAGDGLVCIFALAGRRAKIKVATSF